MKLLSVIFLCYFGFTLSKIIYFEDDLSTLKYHRRLGILHSYTIWDNLVSGIINVREFNETHYLYRNYISMVEDFVDDNDFKMLFNTTLKDNNFTVINNLKQDNNNICRETDIDFKCLYYFPKNIILPSTRVSHIISSNKTKTTRDYVQVLLNINNQSLAMTFTSVYNTEY